METPADAPPGPDVARPAASHRRLARSTAIFSIATGLSRILGLVREIVVRRYFGVEGSINTFTVAFQLPNLLRSLVADAALSAAFVPVFSELLEKGKAMRAWRVASTLFWLVLLGLGGLTALFILLAPWLMQPFGYEGAQEELVVTLSRILFPTVVLLGLSGIVVGILNSYEHFTVPALAPVAWNLVIIFGVAIGVPRADSESSALYVYAGAVLVATVIQFLLPLPWLRGRDDRLRAVIDWRDPAIKRIFVLMLPVTLGLGLINFNQVINTFFAARFIDPELAPSAIEAAFRVYMLPQGIFAVAIATVLFPSMSRLAARGDTDGLRSTVSLGLRQIGFTLMPASAIGAVLAIPIVRLLYERGAFGPEQTEVVAYALIAFSLGLTFNGTMLMLNRAFFQLQAPWMPTYVALANLGFQIVLDTVFYHLGVWGIPLATSIVNVAGTLALLFLFRRRIGSIEGRRIRTPTRERSSRRSSRGGRLRGLVRPRRGVRTLGLGPDRLRRNRRARRRRRLPRGRPYPSDQRARHPSRPRPAVPNLMSLERIRNFSIVAHIDHGKSTLADRILELTSTLSKREMREQVLDSMDLERERGITIKAQAVRVHWKGHELNLIDTPGHVDFTYEVSRALQACEGALLLVDAAQGIQAQTLANAYLAIENNLEIVPVANKIDLPSADPTRGGAEIAELVGDRPTTSCAISAKTGEGVEDVLDAIVERIPPPQGDPTRPRARSSSTRLRPVPRRGRVRARRGRRLPPRERLRAMAQGTRFEVEELGVFSPDRLPTKELTAGEVGYVITGLKDVSRPPGRRHADERRRAGRRAAARLQGREADRVHGLFPTDSDEYPELRDALEKLKLNDASLFYEPETSQALGFGFRCGFLGLLHMEIVRERLEREFDLDLLVTAPNVAYRVRTKAGQEVEVHNPSDFPRRSRRSPSRTSARRRSSRRSTSARSWS